jgi:hypothetical protein
MWRYQEEVGLKAPEALCDTMYYYREDRRRNVSRRYVWRRRGYGAMY